MPPVWRKATTKSVLTFWHCVLYQRLCPERFHLKRCLVRQAVSHSVNDGVITVIYGGLYGSLGHLARLLALSSTALAVSSVMDLANFSSTHTMISAPFCRHFAGKLLLETILNLSKYHREHEKFYAQAPLQQAISLQQVSRLLKTLTDRWSEVKQGDPKAGSPYLGCEDLNETAVLAGVS